MTRLYFPIVSLLLFALTLAGFSDNLFTDIHQPSNSSPKFIIHGLFCLAWMILLVAQTMLVRTRKLRLHRKLGIAGMVIAVGVTLSTLYVFWAAWKGWDAMGSEAKANRLFLPLYALFVVAAWRFRRRPEWHRRLILVATLFMMDPVLGRVFDPVVLPMLPAMPEPQVDRIFWYWFFTLWVGLFLSLFLYDWRKDRRIHAISAAGFALFCAVWTIATLS